MMQIIFLCGLFPEEWKTELLSNSLGPIQNAADTLQKSILKGLSQYVDDVSVLTIPFVGSFPRRFKKMYVRTEYLRYPIGEKIRGRFINIPIIKMISRYRYAKRFIEEWCYSRDGRKVILVYSLHSPFILAAARAKARHNLHLSLIVPDLPEFMSANRGITYRILKAIDARIINKATKAVDSFVLLSKYMADKVGVSERPWIVIEGMSDIDTYDTVDEAQKDPSVNSILYSGSLDERYGIGNLLVAFKLIKAENYRLWVCGEGSAKKAVMEVARSDKRVHYFGQMGRQEVVALQKKATLLVNPRTSEGEFTKYSFPSKIIEYLVSGTPCVMYRLAGIPDEYFRYCFVVREQTPEALSRQIIDACETRKEELQKMGRDAKDFIIQNKSPEKQCRKIYEMFKSRVG